LEYVLGRVFTRSSTASELAVLSEAIQQFRESSRETDDLERQRDAWSMLVQTLFMSSEAIDAP
jgi:hypothetical protein